MPVPSRIVVSEKKDALNMQYQGDVRFNPACRVSARLFP